MNNKILLFIPAYNCAKQITRVLNQLDSEVMNYISNIIIVNNRSTDHTEQVVATFMETHQELPLLLLRNQDNYGLGGSHKVAFQYAIDHNFDYVIVLHGDDQGNIKDLLPLLRNKEYQKYDCCLGARFMKGSELIGYSAFRTFGNRVYDFLFSVVVKKRIYDLGSGLNFYSTQMLREPFYFKFPDKLTFNYCMIMASDYYKHKIKFFPISWREDDQVSNVKMVSQATHVLKMLGAYGIHKNKFINSEMRETIRKEYLANIICESDN